MNNGFKKYHPVVSFLFFPGAFLLLSLEQHPVFLAADVVLLAFFLIFLDQGRYFRQWGLTSVVMILFFFLLTPLLNHRGTHILFYFRDNPIMLEQVIKGIMIALTLFGMLILMAVFNLIISSEKFLFLFSRFFPQWALLLLISMRFVPLFRYRLHEIETVQRVKGFSVSEGTMNHRVRSAVHLIQILLTWSLEEAIQTADSMVARGYGLKKRSSYSPYVFRLRDGSLFFILAMLVTLNCFGSWLGDSVLSLAPVLETPVIHGREWIYLGLNVLYFGLPLIVELKEGLKWHILKQRN